MWGESLAVVQGQYKRGTFSSFFPLGKAIGDSRDRFE